MAKKDFNEINQKELAELIARIEQAIEHGLSLSKDDLKLLLSAITTLSLVQGEMEQNNVTLHKLRKLLGMVRSSERRKKDQKEGSHNKRKTGKDLNKNNELKKKKSSKKKSTPIVHHKIIEYQKGQLCPGCQRGKLYKYEPGQLLRITGHAPYEATQHITEQLRCNLCQEIYKAPLPESILEDGDANQKYGYSARALMVLSKFYSGLPYYHQGGLSEIFGQSISASTIYDQCEYVCNSVIPVFYELQRQAANANQFLLDDTPNRILSQKPEVRTNPSGKGKRLRTGVYSSGLIALLSTEHEIILFETSLGHAGEHLDKILKNRDPNLSVPLTMSDALNSNFVTQTKTRNSYCNAHARRLFFDLEALYPKEISWLLDTYGVIWKEESTIREKGLDDEQRLRHHKKYSLSAMEEIRDWAEKRAASPAFEENSPLGKAIHYFLRHYDKLILFCVMPGALIDNNRMEEKLKIVIRGRKTSHFYKTVIGAEVANVLISLIATAHNAGVNIYDYLLALQKNSVLVKENPRAWLPWTFEHTLETLLNKKLKPDKAA
jgi:transposase